MCSNIRRFEPDLTQPTLHFRACTTYAFCMFVNFIFSYVEPGKINRTIILLYFMEISSLSSS